MAFVIVGLGNTGSEYAKTRHNAGRLLVEAFAATERFPEFELKKAKYSSVSEKVMGGEKVQLVLPEVFMNHSGKGVLPFVKSVKAAQKLLVVRDDLDLPLGTIKITVHGRGSGGHKGVESVMRALKTKEFAQLKVGISAATAKGKLRKPQSGGDVVDHVIGSFNLKQRELLSSTYERAARAIRAFIEDGIETAALIANTK